MEAVAVYSDADADALHVRLADAAVRIGPAAAGGELPADRRDRGRRPGHRLPRRSIPGYGFLAERAAFARAVEEAGLVFVGPPSAAIDALGDKLHARRIARTIGVAPCPGRSSRPRSIGPMRSTASSPRPRRSASRCWSRPRPAAADEGCAGSSGAADLPAALAAGSAEAASAFGDGSVYLEREIRPGPPHRGPAARRRDGPRGRHRGARLLAPAPPPEAGRGGAGAGTDDRRADASSTTWPSASRPRPGCRTPRPPSSCAPPTARSTSSRSTPGSRSSTA